MKKLLSILLAATGTVAFASDYPLTVCVVSGEKLGSMGKPYAFQYEGTDVQLCCEKCKPKFDKDPAKYVTKITDARKPGN
ncbi:MAG: hypothetical protein SFU53_15305 [Terrimicrobiaceae bacterium]|nr:hypothetical protein [Terrimicrobiaceae bacterium]